MNTVRESLMTEEEKRAEKLASQRSILCPEGYFVYVHKDCIDSTMMLFERNELVVYPGQIEEFSVKVVMQENDVELLGKCDCCKVEISSIATSYYRLWVLTKADYQKNTEYRERYRTKKKALVRKQERHQKWQSILLKTPYRFQPIVYWIRKWAYRINKD